MAKPKGVATADAGHATVPPFDELIPFKALAEQMGVSYATLVNWTKRPVAPLAYWKAGGRRYSTREALSAFIAGGTPAVQPA